jgi:hypothetical protein
VSQIKSAAAESLCSNLTALAQPIAHSCRDDLACNITGTTAFDLKQNNPKAKELCQACQSDNTRCQS